jgi:23S rRNA (cytosine1962-C5)-methyltransferase
MQDSGNILPTVPLPTERRIAIRVNKAAESALRNGHPWLFENAITKQSHAGTPGDLAVIFNKQREFLAIGLYDPMSVIRVRVLHHHKPAIIDQNWLERKIKPGFTNSKGPTKRDKCIPHY